MDIPTSEPILTGQPAGSRLRFSASRSRQVQRMVAATCLGVVLLSIAIGCGQKPGANAKSGKDKETIVSVSQPVRRSVTDFVDYTGRTDAVQSVSVRARAQGNLISMPFAEGAEVREGALLFVIDPTPYQAQVDLAKSQVEVAEAQLTLAKATYEQDKSAANAVSKQQLNQDKAAVDVAAARIVGAKASLKAAEINLGYTKVTAPITGEISRYYLTIGNLVVQDSTLLTTIVSMDPMYAYFDMDERTYGRYKKGITDGTIRLPKAKLDASDQDRSLKDKLNDAEINVFMGVEGENGFPHKGMINFINNQVNPATGTIAVRGIFRNERPRANGPWPLAPGMFLRIHLPFGEPHPALLVVDRAIGSDQGSKFVYVIDDENKVQYRSVVAGSLQDDGLRVIDPWDEEKKTGLKPDDWVVVGSLQQLRPLTVVKKAPTEMPKYSYDTRRPQGPVPGKKENK